MGRIYNAISKFIATKHVHLLFFFLATFIILFINLDQFADPDTSVLSYIFHIGPEPASKDFPIEIDASKMDFVVPAFNPDSVRIFNVYMDTWVKVIFGYALSLNYGIIVGLINIIIIPFIQETYINKNHYVEFSQTYFNFLMFGVVVFYILAFSGSFIVPVYIFQYSIWFILGILLILVPYSSYRTRSKQFRKYIPVKTEI